MNINNKNTNIYKKNKGLLGKGYKGTPKGRNNKGQTWKLNNHE